jgi:glycosyltransferase involved in cell wall biosynthesis
MLIYYLSKSLMPTTMANTIQVMKMCGAFARCGNTVTLFATQGPDTSDDLFAYYGVAKSFTIRFDYPEPERKRKPYLGSPYRWSLAREFRRKPPDLFYGRDVVRLLAAAHFGRPVVCEVHDLPCETGRFRRLIEHPALKRIVCITEALKADLIAAHPKLSPAKIIVSPDAADPPPEGLRPTVLRKSRPGQVNVCYTGSLYPGKGMEIIAQLPRDCVWADFHLVGGTDEDIGRWQRELVSFPNVFFYGPQAPHTVAGYIKAADIVLAPYQRRVEGHGGAEIGRWMSPLKVFEYMALAKPIIASDVPVLREALSHGITAILVPPDDTNAWTEVLRSLAREPDTRHALGARAYAAFEDRFTWVSRSQSILDACSAPPDGRGKLAAWLFRGSGVSTVPSEGRSK